MAIRATLSCNIDSFKNIMRVSEYRWEFDMLSEAVTVRLGKQDINDQFLLIDLAADFIRSSFGLSPSTAFPTYPDQSMAAVVLRQLNELWRLKAGGWDTFAIAGRMTFFVRIPLAELPAKPDFSSCPDDGRRS